MSQILMLQGLADSEEDAGRSVGSTTSLALCGSSLSAFWC